jgi:MFS superfamily sulfate permease-like transporter
MPVQAQSGEPPRLAPVIITDEQGEYPFEFFLEILKDPAPIELPSRSAPLHHLNSNLFFAGAYCLESKLPSQGNSEQVVILRQHACEAINSTFINILERYASQVKVYGGRLVLADVSQTVKAQLDHTEITQETHGEENIFEATENVGVATKAAWVAAQAWLGQQSVP